VGSYERNRMGISSVTSHSFWFVRFMDGFHKRVGDIKRQDKAITIDVLKSCLAILKGEWGRVKESVEGSLLLVRRIAELGTCFVIGFCLGLRGEEMPLIEHAGTSEGLKNLLKAPQHIETDTYKHRQNVGHAHHYYDLGLRSSCMENTQRQYPRTRCKNRRCRLKNPSTLPNHPITSTTQRNSGNAPRLLF
jgi:hypothetical protein